MRYLLSVQVDCVVVVTRIADQTTPSIPALRNVVAVLLVEVFTKVTSTKTSIGEICAEGTRFVFSLPKSFENGRRSVSELIKVMRTC